MTKEQYKGAIFKLKIIAANKVPIKSDGWRINLGICNKDLFPKETSILIEEFVCPLDIKTSTFEQGVLFQPCYYRCAANIFKKPIEEIHKFIEDFQIKD